MGFLQAAGRSTLGLSAVLMVLWPSCLFFVQGLNFGIDFRGGTTIRTESAQPVDVGAYRDALAALELGDVSITEVFDPTFGPDRERGDDPHSGAGRRRGVTPDRDRAVEAALRNRSSGYR
jgi:preprotein translocase subunit SecF